MRPENIYLKLMIALNFKGKKIGDWGVIPTELSKIFTAGGARITAPGPVGHMENF